MVFVTPAWTAAAVSLAAAAAAVWIWRRAAVAGAYKAKTLCSLLFVCGRQIDPEFADEVAAENYAPMRLFRAKIDHTKREVSVSLLGLGARKAIYRPGLGATLALSDLHDVLVPQDAWTPVPAWPRNEAAPSALQRAVDRAESPAAQKRRTRARSLRRPARHERYAEGFSRNSICSAGR